MSSSGAPCGPCRRVCACTCHDVLSWRRCRASPARGAVQARRDGVPDTPCDLLARRARRPLCFPGRRRGAPALLITQYGAALLCGGGGACAPRPGSPAAQRRSCQSRAAPGWPHRAKAGAPGVALQALRACCVSAARGRACAARRPETHEHQCTMEGRTWFDILRRRDAPSLRARRIWQI
jgi:hypothetical protein